MSSFLPSLIVHNLSKSRPAKNYCNVLLDVGHHLAEMTANQFSTVCPTRYRTRHFFSNSNTNDDIATKFEQEYVRYVSNEKECVCSAPNCCDTEQRSASQPGSVASGTHCTTHSPQDNLNVSFIVKTAPTIGVHRFPQILVPRVQILGARWGVGLHKTSS